MFKREEVQQQSLLWWRYMKEISKLEDWGRKFEDCFNGRLEMGNEYYFEKIIEWVLEN